MNIAIIPARKGSKRIKNKNIVLFNEKPLIYWTIKAALESKIFEHVIVDTDCNKIASISKKNGAEVPFLRSKILANDFSNISHSTISCIQNFEKFTKKKFKTVFQLMPNCPFRSKNTIIKSAINFQKMNYNFYISFVNFFFTNPWWMTQELNRKVKRIFPKNFRKRSQDLKEMYSPSGALWIANIKSLKKQKSFYGKNFKMNLIDWIEGIDIDNYNELKIARFFYSRLNTK